MTDAYSPLAAKPNPSPDRSQGECLMPAPDDAPTARLEHHELGKPIRDWWYYDANRKLLGIACRYQTGTKKETRIWTCWRSPAGKPIWRCRHWPKPKPLYGLDRLASHPSAPVLLTEGEKAADAAAVLFPAHVAMCWPGGANGTRSVDWGPLQGRTVVLWADHDEPGTVAMASAAECLLEAQASHVQLLNLGALAAYLAGGCSGAKPAAMLQPKDDAADLVDREKWTAQTMAAFMSLPGVLLEPVELPKDAKRYSMLVDAVERWLEAQKLDVDATGRWLRDGKPAVASGQLHRECIHALRMRMKLSAEVVADIFTHIAHTRSMERFESVVSGLCGRPRTDAGAFELVKWCELISGDQEEGKEGLLYHVMLHWMWLVKRSAVGLPRAHDIMPIIYSKRQGNGKSTALRKLCSPFAEIMEPITAEVLTDSRRATELESYLIGVWDEMEGADRKDLTEIKSAITSQDRTYRVLGTHMTARVVRRMNFIGTSNRPVDQIFRDTTGARRYFQVDCYDSLDWEAINALDYDTMWQAVSEQDQAPITSVLPMLQGHQQETVYGDSVTMWLKSLRDDGLEGFVWEASPKEVVTVPAYDRERGESGDRVRWRYLRWVKIRGEMAINGNAFWNRLKEEDTSTLRLGSRDKVTYRYARKYAP